MKLFALGVIVGWLLAFRFIHVWLTRGSVPFRDAQPVEIV